MTTTKTLELPVPDDYVPSEGELNNIVYLVCKYTANWPMRTADLSVCLLMAGGQEEIIGNEGLTRLVEQTCEYVWDHICGEPEEPTADQFFDHIKPILQHWYSNTTPEDRANTR